MLHRERDADDRKGKERRKQEMHDGQFETRQDDPDDIHDQRERAARRFRLAHLAAERRQDATGKLEALDAKGDTDDRQAEDDPAQQLAEEDQEPAEDEEEDIADQ